MAGKICNGVYIQTFKPAISKAYCEGMAYRASDTALNAPITDNPFDGDGSEAEAAWDAGWNAADGEAGGTISIDEAGCCGLRGVSVSV